MIDENEKTYILLGVDKESGVLADLGGTIEKGESTLDVAIREFLEESRSVLSVNLNNTTTIIISNIISKKNKKRKQVILFPKIDLNYYHLSIDEQFQKTIPRNKYEDEMSSLKWIHLDDFLTSDLPLSRSMIEVKNILNE